MNIGIRILSCVMLAAVALTMAVFTLADLRPEDGAYIIGQHEGMVAVYRSGGQEPLSVTDIELAGLRQADREMLSRGIPAADPGEVSALLEDLGS